MIFGFFKHTFFLDSIMNHAERIFFGTLTNDVKGYFLALRCREHDSGCKPALHPIKLALFFVEFSLLRSKTIKKIIFAILYHFKISRKKFFYCSIIIYHRIAEQPSRCHPSFLIFIISYPFTFLKINFTFYRYAQQTVYFRL